MTTDPAALTPAERIEAAAWFFRGPSPAFAAGLECALRLMADDGHEHLAPAWVDGWARERERKTRSTK